MSIKLLETRNAQGVELAACAAPEVDPEWFFDSRDPGPAQQVCGTCPLMNKCLQYALEEKILDGVWGGLTESERRQLQRNSVKSKVKKGKNE